MTKKLIVPDRNNRAEALEVIWRRLLIEEAVATDLDLDLQIARGYMAEGRAPQVSSTVCDISRVVLDRAIIARRLGNREESVQLLNQAFSYAYWAKEIGLCAREAESVPDVVGESFVHGLVALQCFSGMSGSDWFAQWIAPHLHNQFAQPSDRVALIGYGLDKGARRFMALLQRTIVTNEWPAEIETTAMSGWGRLLATLAVPGTFDHALLDFCDWRVANALGYPEMGSTKRRRQSEGWSVLDRDGWEQVFPFELLTLKYAYERATGKQISLDAPHPLLQSHLMRDPFPALEPLWEDDLTVELAAFHAKKFGVRFGLRHPIEARYL